MLETIREYAVERLAELEPDGATRLRHAEYYLALAEAVAGRIFGAEQRDCLDTLEREHDNLRAVLAFAIATGRTGLAMRLLSASWRFWHMRGYLPESREKAERVLAMPSDDEPLETRLSALDAAGGIAYWQGDMERAREWYREEAEVARQMGDRKAEAEAIYNEAMSVAIDANAVDTAKALALDARRRFQELGDRHGEARAMWAVTNTAVFDRDPSEAQELGEQAIAIFREMDDSFMLAWALYTTALMHAQRGNAAAARAALREAVDIFSRTDDVSGYALVLDGFASLESLDGDVERAMRIAGAAAALQDVTGMGLARRNREVTEFYPRDLLKDPHLAEVYEEGRKLTPAEAIGLALHEDEQASASS